jgi:hypothetical protein
LFIYPGYPERLGHCICYAPPGIFSTFFNTIKGFIDAKTRNKIIFLTGDMYDGSKNDIKMKEIIGDNWKILTGADCKYETDGCSPGYNHSLYWPFTMKRISDMNQGHLNFNCYRVDNKFHNNNDNNNNNNNNDLKVVRVDDFFSDDSDGDVFDKNVYEVHNGIYDNRLVGINDFSDEDCVGEIDSNCSLQEEVNLNIIDNDDKNDKNMKIIHDKVANSNLSFIDSFINMIPPTTPLLISFIIINIIISFIGNGSFTFGFLMFVIVIISHLLDINRIC